MFIFVTCDVSPFAGFAWFLARAVLKMLNITSANSHSICASYVAYSFAFCNNVKVPCHVTPHNDLKLTQPLPSTKEVKCSVGQLR